MIFFLPIMIIIIIERERLYVEIDISELSCIKDHVPAICNQTNTHPNSPHNVQSVHPLLCRYILYIISLKTYCNSPI